ncbi:MAG: hypothetical protein WEB00_01465 [Dehalococcoidia bacterium]
MAGLLALSAVALLALFLAQGASAGSDNVEPDGGIKHVDKIVQSGRPSLRETDASGNRLQPTGDEARRPVLGDERLLLALDDTQGILYIKPFTLRAVTANSEAWVANDTNFPDGDCRNGVRTTITDEQARYILNVFDNTIAPKDQNYFGMPNFRDGSGAVLDDILGIPANSYYSPAGRQIVQIDNVRDDNFYDTDNQNQNTYIAGFFGTFMDFYINRNVFTMDAFDWLHRTHNNPPHEPSADPCTSAPARPTLYEGVFAHEYQHLIHADHDADEGIWLNEGLSDLAEVLTGFARPELHVNQKGFDSHINAFLGWNSVLHRDWNPLPRQGGPENSLTVWEDQGPAEILGDYGHAFLATLLLESNGYDASFFRALVNNQTNGLPSVQQGTGVNSRTMVRNLELSALVDGYLDAGAVLIGADPARVQNSNTDATVKLDAQAAGTPGAPPWGSDFINVGNNVTSLVFDGAEQENAAPGTEWTALANGYWWSGYGDNVDRSMAREVTVNGPGSLTFDHYYDLEGGADDGGNWDFGFIQVSTDGGNTWTSQPCTNTTNDHADAAASNIVAELPGYSGEAGSANDPVQDSCDLSDFDGKTVLLALRFMSDSSVEKEGWFVRNLQLDGENVGTPGSLDGWNSQQFYDPAHFEWIVQVVALRGRVNQYGDVFRVTGPVTVIRPTLNAQNKFTLTAAQRAQLAGADKIVVIVTGVPETEETSPYQPYSLKVNGAEKADGQ